MKDVIIVLIYIFLLIYMLISLKFAKHVFGRIKNRWHLKNLKEKIVSVFLLIAITTFWIFFYLYEKSKIRKIELAKKRKQQRNIDARNKKYKIK